MKNMMKEYIGSEYNEKNHLRNFCLYWMKAAGGSGDEWRKKNDLDCIYFNGDLRADTLMSAWTPIKWVADFLNMDKGKKFYKRIKNSENPLADLELLAERGDEFLPKDNKLVQLLDEFLELAELRCNFILLPDRRMNCDRYCTKINGETKWLLDSVPATLYYVFDINSLGRYFTEITPEEWIKRENLDMGFVSGNFDQEHIVQISSEKLPGEPKWLTDEKDIIEALQYMIGFLKERRIALSQEETAG